MAIAITKLYNNYRYETGVTQMTTTPLDLSVGRHAVLFFARGITGTPTISGGRGTWVLEYQRSVEGLHAWVWVGRGTVNDGSIVVNISGGATVPHLIVTEVTGSNVQFVKMLDEANVLGTTSTHTVNTTAAGAESALLAFFWAGTGSFSTTSAPKSGWTELVDQRDDDQRLSAAHWRATFDSSAQITLTGAGEIGILGVALEFEEGEPDETAPTVSEAFAEPTGQTTANGSFDTDENNGIAHWVVTTSSSKPDPEDVIAGKDHLGAAAAASGLFAVAAAGTQTFEITGLLEATDYYLHVVQVDDAGNESDVATSSVFTTFGYVIEGTIVINGIGPTEGIRVFMIDTEAVRVRETYTDSEGHYSFNGLTIDGREYHVTWQHQIGDAKYSGRSAPFLVPA